MATAEKGAKRQRTSPHVHGADQDTASVTGESDWFHASKKRQILGRIIKSYDGPRDLHAVDAFGASGRVTSTWARAGHAAEKFDIKTGGASHDICSKQGCLHFLHMCLRLQKGGIVVAGPPCSLFIWLSTSLHRRTWGQEEGNTSVHSVRLANLIVENFITVLDMILTRVEGPVYFLIEQPMSSWMMKRKMCARFLKRHHAEKISTYMGCYGHDLLKPSFLYGNLPHIGSLKKQCPKLKDRKNIAQREGYIVIDANGGVSGGQRLAEAAAYTPAFCKAIHFAWHRSYVFVMQH